MSAPPPESGPARAPGRSRPRAGWLEWLESRLNLTELFSFLTHFGLIYTPVDTRRPLREVLHEIATRPLVSYSRWPHVLGLLIALLFLLQVASGVLLAFYYQPTADAAYGSTRLIVRDLPLGWLVHHVHAWGSYLLVGVIFLRVIRLFWDGLYRAPREVLWFSAVALGWIAIQADFTGTLLPWDVQSYWAAVRGLEVVWSLPVVGPVMSFLVGGRTISEDVLIRFYVLHIIVLPAVYLGFVWVTFATMRKVGLSRATDRPEPTTTYRRHVTNLAIITLLLFAGLVTLATLVPFQFHGAADPYMTPRGVRPPWYMLAAYTLFQVPLPKWIPGLVVLAGTLAVPFLPALVRAAGDRLDEKRIRAAGVGLLALWLALTVAGFFVERA